MKTKNKILSSFLFLIGMLFSLNLPAWDAATTVSHLEEALKAVQDNQLDTAEIHIKKARQTVKEVIGGSLEVKVQKGSGLIIKARRQAKAGDLTAAADTLKEAIELFKGIHEELKSGRGGLN